MPLPNHQSYSWLSVGSQRPLPGISRTDRMLNLCYPTCETGPLSYSLPLYLHLFVSSCPSLPIFSFFPPPSLVPAELQSVPLLARSPSTNRKYPPIPVDKLEEEMNRRMADDNKLFREEFNVRHPQTNI